MSPTEFSIRNPLAVLAISATVIILGVAGYFGMGVAVMPNVNFPAVMVTTVYPGADPETIEALVTRPIEDAIGGLPNIEPNGLVSVSSQGVSTVNVQFTSAANADLVSVDVERVVSAVRNRLPADADPPTIIKIDPNAQGVATVVLSGPQKLIELQDLAENVLQKQFNALPGVGSTTIRSGILREIHVLVDEADLRSRGLSINQVVNAINTSQLETPAGSVSQGARDYSVYFDSLVTTPQQLEAIVVLQTPNGAVFLRDVAQIEETFKKRDIVVRVNGQEGIALSVVKLPEANTIEVVDRVKARLAQLATELPPGAQMNIVVDASTYTAKSFNTIRKALIEAIFITGFILLLFLHTWRSTTIVLIAIPTSLLITFAMMAVLKYNLNLLTMMALTLSVGILVDDSIVVIENIARHLGMGKPPTEAAIDGRREIGLAAVMITLVDVVVYLPIAILVSGIPAQFLRPFALVIAVATLASLLVSFTLAPLLAAKFLREHDKTGSGPLDRFGRLWDAGFLWLERRYQGLLRWSLPRRWLVVGVGVFSFALGIYVLRYVGNDFFPSGDQSEIDITLTMPPSTSLAGTTDAASRIEALLRRYDEVRLVYTTAGRTTNFGPAGNTTGANTAQLAAMLISPHERHRSSAEIGNELRRELGQLLPEAKIRIGLPNAFGFGGFGAQPIQVQLQGIDAQRLDRLAAEAERRIRGVPGAVGVTNSNDNLQTQIRAVADWSRAADLGISPQQAGVAMRSAIDGFRSNLNQFRQPGKAAVDIRVLYRNARDLSVEDLAQMPIMTSNGGTVRLGQFVTLRQVDIPTRIEHVNRLRSVTIGAEPGEGYLVGDLNTAIARDLASLEMPPGFTISYAGQANTGNSAIRDIAFALLLAVALMYMLMMILFNSLVVPLSVMMSLPLAVIGAFGSMALTGTPFTIFSMLGLAVLVGLVGKNAILLVDYTEILISRGYNRNDALLEAGPTRLRPIVMTTISIIAALAPIVTGLEEGSELLKSAAVVLIGGLLTSTLLTLVFVPAMFTIFDDLHRLLARLGRGRAPAVALQPASSPVPAADD